MLATDHTIDKPLLSNLEEAEIEDSPRAPGKAIPGLVRRKEEKETNM
jgi:hypothetical protein